MSANVYIIIVTMQRLLEKPKNDRYEEKSQYATLIGSLHVNLSVRKILG